MWILLISESRKNLAAKTSDIDWEEKNLSSRSSLEILTHICWKKTSEGSYLLSVFVNSTTFSVQFLLKKLFQYALKIQNENKISVQSSIFYNPNEFRDQNFNPPALLTTSPEMIEIILSYLIVQSIHHCLKYMQLSLLIRNIWHHLL